MIAKLRAAAFYLGYYITGIAVGAFAVLTLPLPLRWRFAILVPWNRFILAWLRLCCGIRYRVIGRENIPAGPVVIMAKHSSEWEGYCLQLLFCPMVTSLKRELLRLPFLGWGLTVLKAIPIDRESPKRALRHLLQQARQRLGLGLSVLVFPEGTRVPYPQVRKFARGGAAIASESGVPIVPVAHDAGKCWITGQFAKRPGLVTVVIGKPIDSRDRDTRELTVEVENWVRNELHKLHQDEAQPVGAGQAQE